MNIHSNADLMNNQRLSNYNIIGDLPLVYMMMNKYDIIAKVKIMQAYNEFS